MIRATVLALLLFGGCRKAETPAATPPPPAPHLTATAGTAQPIPTVAPTPEIAATGSQLARDGVPAPSDSVGSVNFTRRPVDAPSTPLAAGPVDLKRRSVDSAKKPPSVPQPCSIRTTVRLPIPPWADSISLNIGGVLYWYEFRAPARTSFFATFANVPCSVDAKTIRPEQFQFWVTKKKSILVAKKRTALAKE